MKKKAKQSNIISSTRRNIRTLWRSLHPSKHLAYSWEELKAYFKQYDDELLYDDDTRDLWYIPKSEIITSIVGTRVRIQSPHAFSFEADLMFNLRGFDVDEVNYVLSRINFAILYGRVHISDIEGYIKAFYIDELGTDTIALYPERIRRFVEHFDQLTFEVALVLSNISHDRKQNEELTCNFFDRLCRVHPPHFDW